MLNLCVSVYIAPNTRVVLARGTALPHPSVTLKHVSYKHVESYGLLVILMSGPNSQILLLLSRETERFIGRSRSCLSMRAFLNRLAQHAKN